MASLETTRGRQVPAWQQANRYYQQPVDYVNVRQPESTNVSTAPATRRRRTSNGSYTIQKGDTLSAIAQRYGTTVQAIAEANGIADVNKIYVGDSLNIPGNNITRTNTSTQRTTSTNTQSSISTNKSQPTTQEKNRPVKNNYNLYKIPSTYAGHAALSYKYATLPKGYFRNQIAGPNDNIGELGQVYLTRYITRKRNASSKANAPTSKTNKNANQQAVKERQSNITLADVRKNSLKYKIGKNVKRNTFSNSNNRILNEIAASNAPTSKRDIVRDAIFNK